MAAVDGKALRRSFPDAAPRSPPHPVRAFASEARSVMGQMRVKGRSNGIAAVPTLLEMPAPKGRIVTADAMHTQCRTAQAVTAAGGDHMRTPKGDRGAPYEDVKPCSGDPAQDGNWPCHRDADGGHGRIGACIARVVRDIDRLRQRHRRPGLAAVGKVVPTRGTGAGTTTGIRRHIMSAKLSPQRFRHAVRSRRAIGNPPHRVSDVTMNGDRQRNRSGHGPENPALPRRPALNVARTEPEKDAMRGKPERAGWGDNFLPNMIRAAKPHNISS